MSGRLTLVFLHTSMNLDLYWKRFYAALMVSCLLHAALVFMPYLGARATGSGPVVQGGQKQGSARILKVRIVAEAAVPAGAAEPPAQAETIEEPRPAPERSLGIDLLPIPAPAYFTVDQLTKRPQPTSDPRLSTPESDPFPGSGKVVLKVWISDLGSVDSVDVEKSDVPEAVAAIAAAAFSKLRFVPGEINGRRVGTMVRIEVSYDEAAREEGARDDATGSPP